MFIAHTRHSFFLNWSGTQQGEGIEYFLLVLGMAGALMLSGGGRLSADRAIHRRIAGA
jgi:putative oxidoreductase